MTTSRRYFVCAVLLCLSATSVSRLYGQANGLPNTPATGLMATGSYTASETDRVDVTNGNVSMVYPLAKLPPGRGGSGFGLNLLYDSKLWTWEYDFEREVLVANAASNWRYGLGYSLELKEYPNWTWNTECALPVHNIFLFQLRLISPDGSKRVLQLRNNGYVGYRNESTYYPVRMDGFNEYRNLCGAGSAFESGTLTYYTTDGSFLRVDIVIDGDGNMYNNAWTLYLPDGGRVVGQTAQNAPQTIYDRNGNWVTIDNQTLGNGNPARVVTDQFGRSIILETRAGTPPTDRVTVAGKDGQTYYTEVVWESSTTYTPDYDRCPNGGCYSVGPAAIPRRVTRIDLPTELGLSGTQRSYTFTYTAPWGEVSSVALPGRETATTTYGYYLDNISTTQYPQAVIANTITSKTLSYQTRQDGQVVTPSSATWSYSYTPWPVFTQTVVTGPDGGKQRHFYKLVSSGGQNPADGGLVYRTEYTDGAASEKVWKVVEKIWKQNYPYGSLGSGGGYIPPAANPYVEYEITTLTSTTPATSGPTAISSDQPASIKLSNVDKNGNLMTLTEYEWASYGSVSRTNGVPTSISGSLTTKRAAQNTYNGNAPPAYDTTDTSSSYHAPSTAGLPAPRTVRLSNTVIDTAIRSKTEWLYDNPATTANVTTEKRYPTATGSPIQLGYTYNSSYNNLLLSNTDGRGTMTAYTYGPVNGHVLYPTSITAASGTSEARTTTLSYDFWTGQVSGRVDVNNAITTAIGLDLFGRPTSTTESGGTLTRHTNTIYDEVERSVEVRQDLDGTTTRRRLVNVTRYDPLGRVRLTQQMENGEQSAGDTAGIKVQTRYAYEAGKQVVLVSNPYRAASSSNTEETMGWTKTESDPGGRVIRVEHLSAGISQSRGATTTAYNRKTATITDAQTKSWQQQVDSLGRLDRVTEVTGGNAVTAYAYTATDLLSSVTQGSQPPRQFSYDCLGRLTSATQPEISSAMSYVYDGNGNVTQRTDARNTVTNYTYNLFNQISTKSYTVGSDTSATPNVTYSYSTGGRLNSVTTTGVSTTTHSYDDLGRLTGSSQQPWGGTTRSFTYGRNWVDGVTNIGYPSGRSVSYTYDGAGRVTTVTGTKGGVSTAYYQPPAISPELQYAPHGGLRDRRAATFGTETIHYNDRLQTSTITVNGGATQLLGLTYGYGEVSSQNNGNVMSQVIQPLGAEQNYTYESVNRLGTFTETRSGQSFAQGFGYDVWGNRWMSSMTGGVPNGVPNGPAWFNTTTNRLNLLQHDNNGNLRVLSPYTGRYSAENLLAELESAGNGSARFEYDGDGRRVRKIRCGTPSNCTAETSGAVVTDYVYDAMGNLAAEYGPINDPGTRFVFTDALGSTRLTTDAAGNSVRRYDYAPFGEELTPAWTNWRTTAAGYGAVDSFPPKFTGKERDAETGLDYFGARYFSGAQGRFTSADPYMPSADVKDPQSWNRYAYARNNPLRYIDPNGLDWSDLSEEQRRVFQQYADSYNKTNKSKLSTEQVYNTLNESQMATHESVTYALEHTQLVDNQGNNMGNALQQVAGVSKIAGEIPGSSKGDQQFRLYADLKPGAIESFGKAQGFEPSSNKLLGLFQIYHQGFPDSYRQIRRQGVTGMEAGVQPSYNRNTQRSDIDVDYRFGPAHLQPANSDVRAPGNYQKFIDRWPGLRNWWDK
jgi:RHS repeat-associated protein